MSLTPVATDQIATIVTMKPKPYSAHCIGLRVRPPSRSSARSEISEPMYTLCSENGIRPISYARNIVKQLACAAPISSSGLLPLTPSKRVLKP